ncbi:hypothetical protein AB0O01_11925 [Streptomyces sp. NPDC093252]|uniref:terpene synthase family protein n=1 Tax=Streptomyces sp. NPDC093252 TaxID=3154980 RepID=UPI00342F2D91
MTPAPNPPPSPNPPHPVLSHITCPIPPTPPLRAPEIEEHTLAWFARFGFGGTEAERRMLRACAPAHCACMLTPDAPESLLRFSSAYIVWGLLFDTFLDHGDLADRKRNYALLAPQLVRTLNDPWRTPEGLHPVILLIRDMRLYLEDRVAPAQLRRWVDSHSRYMTGVARELLDAEHGTLPTLDDFLYLRMYTAAGAAGAALVDLCGGPDPDPAELETPAVHALTDAASIVMSLFGDLGSAPKEGPLEYNVVNVIARELDCSRAEAMTEAVHLCNAIVAYFCTARESLWPTLTPATRTYLTGLGGLIRGVLDWSDLVPRYREHPASDHPDMGRPARVDPWGLASIGWWPMPVR